MPKTKQPRKPKITTKYEIHSHLILDREQAMKRHYAENARRTQQRGELLRSTAEKIVGGKDIKKAKKVIMDFFTEVQDVDRKSENYKSDRIVHSHEGGEKRHEHPGMGPASFTIDSKDWKRMTGHSLPKPGKKKFTKEPGGEQFPLKSAPPLDFHIIIVDDPDFKPTGEGPGTMPIARMVLGHGLIPKLHQVKS